jgi:FkbM family methyltransferase
MRYIFIDLGAFNGDSIKQFMKRRKLPVKAEEFSIYAFEPNPNCFDALTVLYEYLPNFVHFEMAAAWVKNEIKDFAVDNTKTPFGSSLMKSKRDYDSFDIVQVYCIDFSEWIKKFRDDYVIVKMDVEGSEFPLLAKMLKDGTHKIINQLWLETHPNKVKEYTTKQSDKLFARLRKDIYVEEWE